jgi:hypothetical protein
MMEIIVKMIDRVGTKIGIDYYHVTIWNHERMNSHYQYNFSYKLNIII